MASPREADVGFMREAIRLATRARGKTAPNPLVGSVVVRGQRGIARGYHRRAGLPHGEAVALARAGAGARGATLYVTLEPCAHTGLTPPCVDAVLASGVRRVVVGMRDPDPRTSGRSIRTLRRAGLRVEVGVLEQECRRLNAGFLSRVERGRPFTTLKLASTLDGRIATASGESRWITGAPARAFVHRLRGSADAIAIGSGTATADDPVLSQRSGGRVGHRPTRIVIDSRLRTPPEAQLIGAGPPGSAWILTSRSSSSRRRGRLERAGARLIDVRTRGDHLDLRAAWKALGRLGVNDLLVEGGGGLAAALLRAGLVDRLHLFLAPMLLGSEGKPVLGALEVDRLERAVRPARVASRKIGDDLLVTLEW